MILSSRLNVLGIYDTLREYNFASIYFFLFATVIRKSDLTFFNIIHRSVTFFMHNFIHAVKLQILYQTLTNDVFVFFLAPMKKKMRSLF